MRADVPSSEIMRQTFWLGAVVDRRDPRMRRLADCIAEVRPAVAGAGREFDDSSLLWALAAIMVHLALEAGETRLAIEMFRSNARLLELSADAGLPPASNR